MVSCMFIWTVAAASIGSGFQHGYNTGVLNAPQDIIQGWMEGETGSDKSSSTFLWSIIVAIFCIGGMIGGAITGIIANLLGRKGGLFMNNFIAIIAGLLMGSAKTMSMVYCLLVGRFVVGINCGLNAGLSPLYLNEISPTKVRGAVGSMYQLNITITILLAQLLGTPHALGTDSMWPILLGLIIIPAIYQAVALIFCPESPKFYLEKKEDEEKAKKAMQKLAGDEDISQQFSEMQKDINDSKALPKVTLKEMFSEKKLRKPLMIICFLMAAQQLSGINAVIFYSTEIFKMGKLSAESSKLSTVGVGVVNVITTVASVYLVEKSGRKPLLLMGFGGMAVSTILLFVCLYFVESYKFASYFSIFLVYIYIIFFALGAGSIPWLLGPELFTTGARPMAVSIAVPTNWAFNFLVGLAFLPLQEMLGPAVFIIFIVCQIISLVFIFIFCPETKNRPIDEIVALFE